VAAAGIGQIFYGPSLETMFNAPGLPPHGDPRTPDIIVQPDVDVVYTGSSQKQAEHGGFARDINVILLVSNRSCKVGMMAGGSLAPVWALCVGRRER